MPAVGQYATAIRVGTASAEAILRRFTRTAGHLTYQAMLELGRAQKTIFVARYLRLRELQREVEEALNVIESWNLPCQHGHPLRQPRGVRHQPQGPTRAGRPLFTDPPGLPRLREHPHAPGRAG
jgi:hypothetical protein